MLEDLSVQMQDMELAPIDNWTILRKGVKTKQLLQVYDAD
jgi:hypothetical protein